MMSALPPPPRPPWLCYEEIEKSVRVDADDKNPDDYGSKCSCKATVDSSTGKSVKCFDYSCENWATLTECLHCDSAICQNQRIQHGLLKQLEVKECDNKGFGLFCAEPLIRKGEFIREYVGELVSKRELERRLLATKSAAHLFVMELHDDCFLDSRNKASISRFINHSCEPNCTIEVWTVRRRLCAAICALRDIEQGTELTFDYQWAPSEGRPPTRCFCGTKSCRGYLEVFEDDQQRRVMEVRSGLWVSPEEARLLAGAGGAQWLVHKRVRVWWDGNEAYFEADVLSYDSVTGLHSVYYLVDDQVSAENLWAGSSAASVTDKKVAVTESTAWQLLDETRKEKHIQSKTKLSVDTALGDSASTSSSSFSLGLGGSDSLKPVWTSRGSLKPASRKQPSLGIGALQSDTNSSSSSVIIDKVIAVEYSVCQFIAERFYEAYSSDEWFKRLPGAIDSMNSATSSKFPLFVEAVKLHCSVAGARRLPAGSTVSVSVSPAGPSTSMPTSSTVAPTVTPLVPPPAPPPPAVLSEDDEKLCINFYGSSDSIKRLTQFLELSRNFIMEKKFEIRVKVLREVKLRFPRVFTIDWRTRRKQLPGSDSECLRELRPVRYSPIGLCEVAALPESRLSHLVANPTRPPAQRTPSASAQKSAGHAPASRVTVISNYAYVELRRRFREVVEYLNFPNLFTATHASVLLLRVLESSFDFSCLTPDLIALIASTISLSWKATDIFTSKNLISVVNAAYNSVYRNPLDEPLSKQKTPASPASVLQFYVDKTLKCENAILRALSCDIFVCNVLSIGGKSKMSPAAQQGDVSDRPDGVEALFLLRAIYNYFFYNLSTESSLSDSALVLNTLPFEVSTLCCMFISKDFYMKATNSQYEFSVTDDCSRAVEIYDELLKRGALTDSVLLHAMGILTKLCKQLPPSDIKQLISKMVVSSATTEFTRADWDRITSSCTSNVETVCSAVQAWLSGSAPSMIPASDGGDENVVITHADHDTQRYSQPLHQHQQQYPQQYQYRQQLSFPLPPHEAQPLHYQQLRQENNLEVRQHHNPHSAPPFPKHHNYHNYRSSSPHSQTQTGLGPPQVPLTPSHLKPLALQSPSGPTSLLPSHFPSPSPSFSYHTPSEREYPPQSHTPSERKHHLETNTHLSSSKRPRTEDLDYFQSSNSTSRLRMRYPWLSAELASLVPASSTSQSLPSETSKVNLENPQARPVVTNVNGSFAYSEWKHFEIESPTCDGKEFANNSTDIESCALLMWPAPKVCMRDIRKMHQGLMSLWAHEEASDRCTGIEDVGVAASGVLELGLLQHVHYFASTASVTPDCSVSSETDDNSKRTFSGVNVCDVILEPMAVKTISINLFRDSTKVSSSSSQDNACADNDNDSVSVSVSDNSTVTGLVSEGKSFRGSFGEHRALNKSARDNTSDSSKSGTHDKVTINKSSSDLSSTSPPAQTCLVAVVPRDRLSLPLSWVMHGDNRKTHLSGLFFRSICFDMFAAVEHCASCGVVFKYISLDNFTFSRSGRVLLTSFSGAVILPIMTTFVSDSRHLGAGGGGGGAKAISSGSVSNLPTIAPEVLFGAEPSVASSVWTTALACCSLLTGNPLINPATSEAKQVQYIFATLGTPKQLGSSSFSGLRFSEEYGQLYFDKVKDKMVESSSRVLKILTQSGLPAILSRFSTPPGPSSTNSAIQLLVLCTQLPPEKRPGFQKIFNSNFFLSHEEFSVQDRYADMTLLISKVEKRGEKRKCDDKE